METFKLGDRVKVIGKNAKGTIAFIGKTHLSDGIMYGIALDKPKGRCSGEIGNSRYFVCPKDHGVFVRACQLEMVNGNLSDYSEDYTGDVTPRPVYPNYLKFSSKMNFRKSKHHSKSKENVSKVKSPLKQDLHNKQSPLRRDLHNKQKSDYEKCYESSSPRKLSKDSRLKTKKKRHLSRKRGDKHAAADENFLIENIMAEKISMQTHKIDSIRLHLKKLETYIRWSRRIGSKENQIKNHLDIAIDNVIRNMVEIVGNGEMGIDYDHSRGDIGLEKENDTLLHCIWDLESKNETLVECITKIRGFLLNSWKLPSRGKNKGDVHRNEKSERSENGKKPYSSKTPEAQSISNLLPENQHLDEIFQENSQTERETESIKRYLESLNFDSKNKASPTGLHLKEENGLIDSPKRDHRRLSENVCVKNYLESKNNNINELNKDLSGMCVEKSNKKCEERDCSKPNTIYEDSKLPVSEENDLSSPTNEKVQRLLDDKSKIKHKTERQKTQSHVSNKRLKWEQNTSNINIDTTDNEKDPAKEFSEFISNMMTNISSNEQRELAPEDPTKALCELISNFTINMTSNGQNEMAPKDSPSFKNQNINPSTASAIAGKCYSYPDSENFENASNSSHKSKSADTLKFCKSVLARNPSKSKTQKKRMHFKKMMEVEKQ